MRLHKTQQNTDIYGTLLLLLCTYLPYEYSHRRERYTQRFGRDVVIELDQKQELTRINTHNAQEELRCKVVLRERPKGSGEEGLTERAQTFIF